MRDDDVDVRVEIQVAMFWRNLIGDADYAQFDPRDLFRWYMALELMGPDDARELFQRRQVNRPMSVMHGLVPAAPHPPVRLVRAWLEQHETKVRTAPYWSGLAVFTTLAFFFGVYMNGCQNLQPTNNLLMNPPSNGIGVAAAPLAVTASPAMMLPHNPSAPIMPSMQAPGPAVPTVPSMQGPPAPSPPAGANPAPGTSAAPP